MMTPIIAPNSHYLFERSAFYREKLKAAGFASLQRQAAFPKLPQLPFTEKSEIRASCTPENPIGTHLCVDSFRNRPHLFDQRHHGHAKLHSAHGHRPRQLDNDLGPQLFRFGCQAGQRIVSTYNAGPFVAGAALGAFDKLGMCHIPVGTGNTERLMTAIRMLKPEAAVLTPSYAAHLVEWAAERRI